MGANSEGGAGRRLAPLCAAHPDSVKTSSKQLCARDEERTVPLPEPPVPSSCMARGSPDGRARPGRPTEASPGLEGQPRQSSLEPEPRVSGSHQPPPGQGPRLTVTAPLSLPRPCSVRPCPWRLQAPGQGLGRLPREMGLAAWVPLCSPENQTRLRAAPLYPRPARPQRRCDVGGHLASLPLRVLLCGTGHCCAVQETIKPQPGRPGSPQRPRLSSFPWTPCPWG